MNKQQAYAQLIASNLGRVLARTPPDALPIAFCRDVQMVLDAIDSEGLQLKVDKEALKQVWLMNALALRLLLPKLEEKVNAGLGTGVQGIAAKAMVAGLRNLVNPACLHGQDWINNDFMDYMNAVAERGKTAATL